MKEAIIYLLFDNWCNSEHEPEVKEAMDKAIQNPTEDTIFQQLQNLINLHWFLGICYYMVMMLREKAIRCD